MITLLWILAVILVVAGIVTVLRGQVLLGVVLDRHRTVGRSRRREHLHLSDDLES